MKSVLEGLGLVLCILALLLAGFTLGHALGGYASRKEIAAPCRDNGGVRQWLPTSTFELSHRYGIVVCMDGQIGEVK